MPSSDTQTLLPWPEDALAIVPMRNLVLFPHVVAPVSVGRQASLAALDVALRRAGDRPLVLGLLLQRDAGADEPRPDQLYEVGTVVRVLRASPAAEPGESTPAGPAAQETEPTLRHLVCQGLQRFRVQGWLHQEGVLVAHAQRLEDEPPDTAAEAAGLQLRERASELLSLLPGVPAELVHAVQATRNILQLGDIVAGLLDVEVAEKQQWLEQRDGALRLEQVLRRVDHRIEVLRLSQEIGLRTREKLQDRERRFLLREQMQAIRKELGEEGNGDQEAHRLEEALAKAGMPDEVAQEARTELRRLQQLPEASSEHGLLRTWLQWMTELPWKGPERPQRPVAEVLARAREVLDAEHHGLEKVKRTVIEYLAVRHLQPEGHAPILCFLGPPGVGKTSLGQSIARALDRPFGRLSLGGVHDEAEIRGHRRTYVGAMPGSVIQTLRRCGARDAVIMLDEIDKMSASSHGDPTAALLEVLDPAQNHTFRDHYLGVSFDLSQVLFIATANVIDTISAPLRDRLEVIELPGYTTEDKRAIARGHLLPRQRQSCGVPEGAALLGDALLDHVIERYTREAGVRQLDRQLGRLMRHAAWQWASSGHPPAEVDAATVAEVLGPPRHEAEMALRHSLTGVATGLAWTPVGGDILFVEASRVPGTQRLLLTGQLGEVMRESAQAALTLLKGQSAALKVPASAFEAVDVHVHVPAGAVPKDGPSAGVALYAALASLFSGRPVRHDIGMTGEISLRGQVLPVGGIREKVLAAVRAGLRQVVLPTRNQPDLQDLPASARAAIQVVWVEAVEDLLEVVLCPAT